MQYIIIPPQNVKMKLCTEYCKMVRSLMHTDLRAGNLHTSIKQSRHQRTTAGLRMAEVAANVMCSIMGQICFFKKKYLKRRRSVRKEFYFDFKQGTVSYFTHANRTQVEEENTLAVTSRILTSPQMHRAP